MKARELCTYLGDEITEGYDTYKVRPSIAYPAAIAFIATELVDAASQPEYLRQPIALARKVTADGWKLAVLPGEGLESDKRKERADALEAARLVFTALLREQNGGPIHMKIVVEDDQDAQYRL